MLFWFLILLISTSLVIGIALPLMRTARSTSEGSITKAIGANRIISLGLLVVAPIAALAIYLNLGTPAAFDPTFREQMALQAQRPTATQTAAPVDSAAAMAALPAQEREAIIQNMVNGLAQRVSENPEDYEGLRMLARSYGVLGQGQKSADTYKQLVERDNNASADDWRNYATALVSLRKPTDSSFDPDLSEVLKKLLTFNENDPLALFYLGLSAKDRGDGVLAITYWQRLKTILPADAPIFSQLDTLIEEAKALAP